MDLIPKIEGEPYAYQAWPSYAEGPDGERCVFNSEAEVPAGWRHHGETKKGKTAPTPPISSLPPPPPPSVSRASTPVDKAGVALDPARHTGTLTKAGLWRMKVGVSRPDSEGQILDL